MKMAKCISNVCYPTSLTVGNKYVVIEDGIANSRGRIRVIDNTNESYLYPMGIFEINTTEDSIKQQKK